MSALSDQSAAPDADRPPRLMVIAGEVSGDEHAARVVAALRQRCPDAEIFGIGGEALRAAGVETLHDIDEMAVMGIGEVLRRLLFFRRVFHEMLAEAATRRPDAVLFVDYPGFNLRLAARTHALGLRNVYYICPKVWAWKASRIPRIAACVDRLLTIFPFEAACFAETRLRVDFVGHPLVDEARHALGQPSPDLPWQGDGARVALLPGSRPHEIRRLLPVLAAAAVRLERRHPGATFIIPCPNAAGEAMVRRERDACPDWPERCAVVAGQTHQVLRQSRAAIVASGTATLDAALMRCPMVITYRAAPSTALVARIFLRIEHVGLVNIVAGREVCRELLQGDATPEALSDAVSPLIDDTPERARMAADLDEVVAALGEGGAAAWAADALLEEAARSREGLAEPLASPDRGGGHEGLST